MRMFLSEAIEKRQKLFEKAEAMDKWMKEQRFGTQELKWNEMIVAIEKVVSTAFEEWQKYNEAIEKDINQLEVEIPKG